MDQFDKSNVGYVRELLNRSLDTLRENKDLTIHIGSITYSDNDMSMRLTVSNGSPEDAARRNFEKYCYRFDLNPEDFGERINLFGIEYIICGIKQKSYRYPILCRNPLNDKIYKFQSLSILNSLGR